MVELFILKDQDQQVLDVPTDYTTWTDVFNTSTHIASISGNTITDDNPGRTENITKKFIYDKSYDFTKVVINVDKEASSSYNHALIQIRDDMTVSDGTTYSSLLFNKVDGTISSQSGWYNLSFVDNGNNITIVGIINQNINISTLYITPAQGSTLTFAATGSLTINSISLKAYNYIQYLKTDLYKDETIQLTDTIQDIRDIGSLFTSFTQDFNIPASPTNNKLFGHWYENQVTNSFDARFKVDAIIKINGSDYKKGKISLIGASLKDNQVNSYNVVFYGNTVTLKDLLGDDELKDLATNLDGTENSTFSGYDFLYSSEYARDGFKDGYFNGDLIFPFISGKNYYFYDSNAAGTNPAEGSSESRNINPSASTSPRGVNYLDLKPAIKVSKVLEAIEERYQLRFSEDFFTDSNAVWEELYLWLHRERGLITEQLGGVFFETKFTEEYQLDSNFSVLNTDYTWTISAFESQSYLVIKVYGDAARDDFSVTITDENGNTPTKTIEKGVTSAQGGNGVDDFIYVVDVNNNSGTDYTSDFLFTFNSDSAEELQFGYDATIGGLNAGASNRDNFTAENIIDVKRIKTIPSQMPKMKVIDFLTGMFKLFNLTAYFDGEEVVVKTLDSYYQAGQTYDLTKWVDVSKTDIERSNLYSEINMEFEKYSTFAVLNANEITGDDFGNEYLDNTNQILSADFSFAFDGGKYDIKAPFEKMMFERMNDQSNENILTNHQWGWMVSKDANPVLGKPLLFYAENVTENILFDNGGGYETLENYFRPHNILADKSQSLHYGSEFDEFTSLENTNSLFQNYWKNTIEFIYDRQTRVIKLTAYLPMHILVNVKLNDVLVIHNKKYRINSIKVNLQTGKADLELITDLGYYD